MAFRRVPACLAIAMILGAPWACSSSDPPPSAATGSGGSTSTSSVASVGSDDSASVVSSTVSSSGSGGDKPTIVCGKSYSNIKAGPCDLLQQGCPAGESCTPIAVGNGYSTKCTPADGLKGIKKSCAVDSECQAGLFCIFGFCTPVCCPDNNEPCGSGICDVSVLQANNSSFFMACSFLQQCTLLTKDACPKGSECHLQDTKTGLAACIPHSANTPVDEGGQCTYLNDCKDMQTCFASNQDPQGVCRWYCHLSEKNNSPPGLGGCPKGETCQAFPDFGVADLGVCLPK